MPGEIADAVVIPSPPDKLPAPASTPAGAVADSPVEPSVAADVGMVEAPPPVVIPDLPIHGHEERAAVVAEIGERRPATLAEGGPVRRLRRYPMHRLQGDPTPWSRGAQSRGLSWGAATLFLRSSIPMSGVNSRSGSGVAPPRSPYSSSTTSWRRSLGIVSVSIPRRR
jgi:hypothetical protein